jgi:hypothetical protein
LLHPPISPSERIIVLIIILFIFHMSLPLFNCLTIMAAGLSRRIRAAPSVPLLTKAVFHRTTAWFCGGAL